MHFALAMQMHFLHDFPLQLEAFLSNRISCKSSD